MNVSNQTKKAKKLMMYGWMMAFLILGSSGESLGSGTGASMDLGDAKKRPKITENNKEEKKHDNEEEKEGDTDEEDTYGYEFSNTKYRTIHNGANVKFK